MPLRVNGREDEPFCDTDSDNRVPAAYCPICREPKKRATTADFQFLVRRRQQVGMMKKTGFTPLALMLGGGHFLACVLILPVTRAVGQAPIPAPLGDGLLGILYPATQILYFPILSQALYPRHWFPGLWILVPTAANSLLWGVLLAGLAIGLRRTTGK